MTTNNTSNARVVIRPHSPVYATAERTSFHPKDETFDRTAEIPVTLYLIEDRGRRFMCLDCGGEGRRVELTPHNVELLQVQSWVAARGGRGIGDRLVVPNREIRRFFSRFGIEVVRAAA